MTQKRSLLLVIGYGFTATLSIFYGLVEKQSLFVTFVCFHLLVCFCIPVLHAWWEGSLRKSWLLAWGKFEGKGTIRGLAFGVLLLIGGTAGIWLLLQAGGRAVQIRGVLEAWGLADRWIWWFSLYLTVVNSLLEELFWRGFVLQRLARSLARSVAVLLTSFFYSLYHLVVSTVLFGYQWGCFITLLIFAVGGVWGWMKERFPSVYPTWISHMLADLGLVIPVIWWIY